MTRTRADGSPAAHHGVDALAPYLTPVGSADRGKVVFAGWERVGGEYGRRVIVAHANEAGKVVSFTSYSHLYDTSVDVGDEVVAGQQLGRVGNSGNAEGTPPHLHFEITKDWYPGRGRPGLEDRFDPAEHLTIIEYFSPK